MGICVCADGRTHRIDERVKAITDVQSLTSTEDTELDALDTMIQILAVKLEKRVALEKQAT